MNADSGPTSERHNVVTIDGPAGSGKSTTAREVARRLGFRHLDSGALYRALTLAVIRSGLPEEEWESLDDSVLAGLDLRLEPVEEGFRVLLGGAPLDAELRTPAVTARVSRVAAIPAVRRRLFSLQREVLRWAGVVADGRDMGTVVFPEAGVKIFLTASLEERARRRLLEQGGPLGPEALGAEVARIRRRDGADESRTAAPLRPAPDAHRLDTTGLSFEEQVERIVALATGLTTS